MRTLHGSPTLVVGGWVQNESVSKLHRLLHRKGIARVLNSSGNNMNPHASAYIETRGPAWLGPVLWKYAMRHLTWPHPDWNTVTCVKSQKLSSTRHRWTINFERV